MPWSHTNIWEGKGEERSHGIYLFERSADETIYCTCWVSLLSLVGTISGLGGLGVLIYRTRPIAHLPSWMSQIGVVYVW